VPNYCSYFSFWLACENDENDVSVSSEDTPHSEPFEPVLFWELPLLKTRLAAELAENGCFLLINTL